MKAVKDMVLAKVVLEIIGIAMIILVAYLIIDFGNATSIIDKYDSLRPSSSSGFSKSLQFLETYTKTTKDTSLAISKGMSREEADYMANGGTLQGGDGYSDFLNEGMVRPPLSGTWKNQLDTLATSGCIDAGHFNSSNFRIGNVQGIEYIWELQSSGQYPGNYDSNHSVNSHGCFLFAMSAILSNKSGTIISVADMFRKDNATVSYSDTYTYMASGGNKFNLDGSMSAASTILNLFNMNNGIERIAENESVPNDFDSKISSAIDSGHYILYYCHDGHGVLASSSGEGYHWSVIVGYDANNYYFLCNGERSVQVSKETVKSKCRHAYAIK